VRERWKEEREREREREGIAGNFHMVQNFAFFSDRLGAAKI
jgi:hypothetical protein